jgi:hypothetical protein
MVAHNKGKFIIYSFPCDNQYIPNFYLHELLFALLFFMKIAEILWTW